MRKLTLCLIQLSKALFRGLNMRSGAMILYQNTQFISIGSTSQGSTFLFV